MVGQRFAGKTVVITGGGGGLGGEYCRAFARESAQVVAVDLGGRTTKAVHVQRRGESFSLVNYALLDAPI